LASYSESSEAKKLLYYASAEMLMILLMKEIRLRNLTMTLKKLLIVGVKIEMTLFTNPFMKVKKTC